MNRRLTSILLIVLICGSARAEKATDSPHENDRDPAIRIGAVAYAPSVVTVFRELMRYLNNNELPSDFVLYASYDALIDALNRGDVDIAWNTPLAHGKFHVANRCASQTLVMRDVDCDVRAVLIARHDAEIDTLADLVGKRLVLGSKEAAEATVLPLHFLKSQGLNLSEVTVVSLDEEVDSKGNPCASPQHVLAALRQGRGDAGIITADLWERVNNQSDIENRLRLVWTSPAFSHCVFTASSTFDKNLAARFTALMTAMDPEDPATANVMRLEGTRKWLPGSPTGFASLIEALRAE